MDRLQFWGDCPTLADTLLVLLPGAHMAPVELQEQGFAAALRQRGLVCDLVVVDSHLGHVADRSVLRRLRNEVVQPARAQGYRHIWLAGISLGGFLSLGYAARHPGEVDGVFAIAPYVGRRPLLQALAAAGSAGAWAASARPRDGDDLEHDLWTWLARPAAGRPPVWLGYGSEDRLAEGHRLLQRELPPERVSAVPGGHDWPPWRRLWGEWLDRGLLPARCPA
ncbi:MAG: alpha/beta hydrolase [Rubrivivax sp.]|nr:alpha/beta hydrolase [Rubrivivax sp.]